MTSNGMPSAPQNEPTTNRIALDSSAAAGSLFWLRVEAALDRAGDWLNPILVKETRQALKSKQFSITFSLLLLLGWFWTALFVVFTIPTVYYVPMGPYVLGGYLFVLTIPMLIVVPYAAFRSLAAEREDGTFELLSITTLAARQIVWGKLGSAVVQMIVYYSALAPCVAFTYLLRGLDILTIFHLLGYTFLASLLLSTASLMLATATRSRHWQLMLSVVLVMALLGAAMFWFGMIVTFLAAPTSIFDQWQMWLSQLAFLTFYVTYIALFLQIAAGQISFASENRSTPIRVILFVQQILIIGWCACIVKIEDKEGLIVMVISSVLHWIIAGVFLTAEQAKLSPRALRNLPQSLFGRVFLTWFNPGAVTGYLFATSCVLGTLLLAGIYAVGWEWFTATSFDFNFDAWYFMICAVGYFCFYLGFSRLVVVMAGQLGMQVSMLLSVLMQILIAFLGCLIPLFLATSFHNWNVGELSYSMFQLTNWIWTLEQAQSGSFNNDDTAVWCVFIAGLGMFLFHVALASHETAKRRLIAPTRVREEDAASPQKPGMFEI